MAIDARAVSGVLVGNGVRAAKIVRVGDLAVW